MKSSEHSRRLIAVVFVLSLSACASLPENTGRTESRAYGDTQDTALGRSIENSAEGHGDDTGFYLLSNGLDAFVAPAALANLAEISIDTQYYMIHNDVVGSLFVDRLYQAAERGVRVRLLIDDIDQDGRDSGLAILDAHPLIEVRIFESIRP